MLHAHLPAGLDGGLTQVAPVGRHLVADGFRSALLLAAAMLLVAAATAAMMPRLDAREPAVAIVPGNPGPGGR